MNKYKKVPVTALLTIVCCIALLTGCSTSSPVSRNGFLLNTTISITLYNPTDNSLLDDCFDLISTYEELFSRTIEGSDIWRINHASGKPVKVSDKTAQLLLLSTKFSTLSHGAFDTTIAPVSSLWDFTSTTPTLPNKATLSNAVKLVDYNNIIVTPATTKSPATVQLINPQSSIDLGGIAKGYIADRIHDYLKEQGVSSALINLGGNIYAVGTKNKKSWNIGIRNPQDSQKIAAKLSITDKSVVTSGCYERSFEINGVLYHHILDPSTGLPVHNGLSSVTIVCARSADADALSTACFVLGKKQGLDLIESLPDTEALFISNNDTLTASSGLKYKAVN